MHHIGLIAAYFGFVCRTFEPGTVEALHADAIVAFGQADQILIAVEVGVEELGVLQVVGGINAGSRPAPALVVVVLIAGVEDELIGQVERMLARCILQFLFNNLIGEADDGRRWPLRSGNP